MLGGGLLREFPVSDGVFLGVLQVEVVLGEVRY